MGLQPLRYFLAVARAGSFVRAAEALSISQPSLSQQIQKLERELGVHLFDRLGHTVRLTAYGGAFRGELELALLALPIKHNETVCSELFREPLLRKGHCLRGDVLTSCTKARANLDQLTDTASKPFENLEME
jgi:DNA-binding transcriptional LysR family regulator